ncbi:MAG: nuclear transport factor 2 family protein [Desulfarculaceae bacterium]|nr:nuclear transport factor 2 family protein [Desulfarculaceae bacterium]MCF8072609.1 nuclear transport factor 2 family protein [Desulfarculaceae bacterium]MCF8103319.1 nuclear transport factor 2 family protein [Desulfarculaceae bacterium]MCF8117801.1 nuclear transport factor 2 family protein [Desulfarculaceae bacterium]
MKLTPQAIADVRIAIDGFLEAYGQGDLDGAMSYFLQDDAILNLGTGADERQVGWEEVRAQIGRDLTQSQNLQVSMDWFKAGGQDGVAWAASECSVRAETEARPFEAKMRISYTLVKTGEGWKIVLSHGSIPLAGQEEGQSFPGE